MARGFASSSMLVIALLAAALVAAACASVTPSPYQEQPMAAKFTRKGSRVGPPGMAPVVFEGKRYEQIMNGALEGLGQRTGLMAIYDAATNERVAWVKVYDTPRDPRREADVQDVFFTAFRLMPETRELFIENERHGRFAYRIDDGTVRALE